jgi:hypothetical protein
MQGSAGVVWASNGQRRPEPQCRVPTTCSLSVHEPFAVGAGGQCGPCAPKAAPSSLLRAGLTS